METDYVNFVGSFSPASLAANDKTVFYLGDDNNLYYPNADMTVGSCRAVFLLKGLTADNPVSGVRAFVLNFGEETNAIENGIMRIEKVAGAWYSLDGRKLSGKPTQKGIYIYNGQKMLIK